jgi:hypothetical protein
MDKVRKCHLWSKKQTIIRHQIHHHHNLGFLSLFLLSCLFILFFLLFICAFLAFWTVRNKFLLLINHPIYGFCYRSPNRLRHSVSTQQGFFFFCPLSRKLSYITQKRLTISPSFLKFCWTSESPGELVHTNFWVPLHGFWLDRSGMRHKN